MEKEITVYELEKKARQHLEHIINLSNKDKDKLLFKFAGFYGTLLEVLKENKHGKN